MKTSLLLLALLGLASALQPGLEYEYRYHSRIATGIPELQRQFAGAAIRASVTVQLLGEDLMVQMTNVEFADMNGKIHCDSMAPLPLTYHPLPEVGEIFEKPFLINGTEGLIVSHDEPKWITNVRKGVAALFTVKPLRTHEKHDGLLQTQAFHSPALVVDDETSLAGICENRYVLTKLPDYLKEEHVEHIEETVEEDVQWESDHPSAALKTKKTGKGGKGSKKTHKGGKGGKGAKGGKLIANVPKLGHDVYVLTKSVNFDMCRTMVKFQNYGYGIYCKLGSSQCGTLLSRSSTGSFYLRGSSDALRIERVEIEGNVLMNPRGYETEKIRTITNQTLELKAVRPEGTPLELPASTRHVDSFMYEVDSSVASTQQPNYAYVTYQQTEDLENTPGFYPNYIVSGLPIAHLPSVYSTIVTKIRKLLEGLWTDFKDFTVEKDESRTDVTGRMGALVELIMTLDYNELNGLFSSYDANDDHGSFIRDMLIDIMASAGTDTPVRVLVEQIKNHAISTERAAEVFMALSNNLQMPDHSLPRLIELLKGMDMNHEFQLTSSLVLNLATAINRLCLIPHANDTFQKKLVGHHFCNAPIVLNDFLRIIEKGLKETQDVGHKMVYIHALTFLTTDRKYYILKPIILGNTETDYRVRSLACYALQTYNTPKDIITEIYALLMPVFENQGEHFAVRMSAIGALLSWEPDTAWWHRLAVASWRDPSRQMQSYISHLISGVAERNGPQFDVLRQRARHVLPMTKHFPHSQRFSMTLLTGAYLETIETGIVANVAWRHTVKSYIPVHIYEVLIARQGSFFNLIHEFIFDGPIDDLFKSKQTEGEHVTRDTAYRRAFSMYNQALMSLRMEEYTHFENFETTEKEQDKFILAARMFYNMLRVFMTGAHKDKMVHIPRIPPSWNLVKYIIFNQIYIALPTDVGLPIIVSGRASMGLYNKGHFNMKIEEKTEVEANTNIFASLQKTTKAQVPMPWNGKAITSGVEARRDFTLPLTAKANIDIAHNEGHISVSPIGKDKVSFVRHYNHPFTVRASLLPLEALSAEKDFKIIMEHKKPFLDQADLGQQYTGMAVDHTWVGDIESPLNAPSIFELLSASPEELFRINLGSTLQYYECRLNYDPVHSKTNTISISFTAALTEKKDTYSQFSQEGQFTNGGQEKSSYDYDFQEFQEGGSEPVETMVGNQYSISDTSQERLAKMKQHHEKMGSPSVSSVSGKVEFSGSEVHKYEAVLTWTSGDHSGGLDKTLSKAQATFLKGTDVKMEHTMCIDVQSSRPYLSHLADLSDILEHDLKSKWSLELREGENCNAPPVVEAEVYLDMTQHRKDTILSTLASEDFCAKDLEDHEHIQAIHDEGHIQISWNKDLMDCSPLMNFTYHVYDLTRSLLFPHVTYNYCHAKNEPGKITVEGTRSIDTNLWTVWLHKPTETAVIDHLKLYPIFEFDHDYRHTDYDIPLLHDECHVYEHHIVTFDGLDYPFEKDLCWQVLTMDVDHHGSWMLLHRYAEYPEPGTQLRFINPKGSVVVDITLQEVKVNGKQIVMAQNREVVRHEGKTQAIIELYKDEVYVEFPEILSVSMKTSHIVVKLDHYTVGGLCGTRDGEVTGDLQGPNRCVYYKPEMFTTAWMAGGDGGCDPYAIEELVAKVEEYQQHCPRLHTQATGPAHNWH